MKIKSFARRLWLSMKKVNFGVNDLSNATGLTPYEIGNYLLDDVPVSEAHLQAIANACCVDSDWLRTGDTPKEVIYKWESISSFRYRLVYFMQRDNLSQTEVASKIGVVQGTVSHWVNNVSGIKLARLLQLANLFNIEPDHLHPNFNMQSSLILKIGDIKQPYYSIATRSFIPITYDQLNERIRTLCSLSKIPRIKLFYNIAHISGNSLLYATHERMAMQPYAISIIANLFKIRISELLDVNLPVKDIRFTVPNLLEREDCIIADRKNKPYQCTIIQDLSGDTYIRDNIDHIDESVDIEGVLKQDKQIKRESLTEDTSTGCVVDSQDMAKWNTQHKIVVRHDSVSLHNKSESNTESKPISRLGKDSTTSSASTAIQSNKILATGFKETVTGWHSEESINGRPGLGTPNGYLNPRLTYEDYLYPPETNYTKIINLLSNNAETLFKETNNLLTRYNTLKWWADFIITNDPGSKDPLALMMIESDSAMSELKNERQFIYSAAENELRPAVCAVILHLDTTHKIKRLVKRVWEEKGYKLTLSEVALDLFDWHHFAPMISHCRRLVRSLPISEMVELYAPNRFDRTLIAPPLDNEVVDNSCKEFGYHYKLFRRWFEKGFDYTGLSKDEYNSLLAVIQPVHRDCLGEKYQFTSPFSISELHDIIDISMNFLYQCKGYNTYAQMYIPYFGLAKSVCFGLSKPNPFWKNFNDEAAPESLRNLVNLLVINLYDGFVNGLKFKRPQYSPYLESVVSYLYDICKELKIPSGSCPFVALTHTFESSDSWVDINQIFGKAFEMHISYLEDKYLGDNSKHEEMLIDDTFMFT